MEPILAAKNLTKRYGELIALDGIDFKVLPGECFGFLGPNGAGKTTTVRMICAAGPITSGSLRVFGKEITNHQREIKAEIGVCPQDINLDSDFSVFKNLIVFARYFGIDAERAREKAEELIRFFQLEEKRDQKIENLSGGLKKRLLVVRALINDPRLVILDEPTAGLDPQARHQIWDKIRELKKAGKTILLTTHYMEEASSLCDRLVIMDRGKIVERGTPAQLIDSYIGSGVVEIDGLTPDVEDYLVKSAVPFEFHEGRVYIYTDNGHELLAAISGNMPAGHVVLRQSTLEDVFLKLTGRQLRE